MSDPAAGAPPQECAAPLRLELNPILDKATVSAPTSENSEGPKANEKKVEENPCAAGYVYAAERCTKPTANEAYLCEPGDRDGCKAQCDKGHAGSCFNYAASLSPAGSSDATAYFLKACDGTNADGCARLASDVKSKVRGCQGGDDSACISLVTHFRETDPSRALNIATKACDGKDRASYACEQVAAMMVKQERYDQALPYARKACDGQFTWCRPLIKLYQLGKGTKSDPAAADALIKKICSDSLSRLTDKTSGDAICGDKGGPSKSTATAPATTKPSTTKPSTTKR